MYRLKPPSTRSSTSLLSPITIKAPVFAFKMFSNPSLIAVPGEIIFNTSK